jgi:hypothetical protein
MLFSMNWLLRIDVGCVADNGACDGACAMALFLPALPITVSCSGVADWARREVGKVSPKTEASAVPGERHTFF